MGKSFEKFAGEGVNDANYDVTKFGPVGPDGKRTRLWVCPFYEKWMNLMRRAAKGGCRNIGCYSDVEICEEWKTFSNFKEWMEKQDWQGKELDKDLIGTGELYSPENCCFINTSLNTALAGYKTNKLLRLRNIQITKYAYVTLSEKFTDVFDAIDALYGMKIKHALSCAEHDWEVQAINTYFLKHKEQSLSFVKVNIEMFPIKQPWRPKEKPVKQLTAAKLTPIHRVERMGREFVNKQGDQYKVVEYISCKKVVVEFENGTRKVAQWSKCLKGSVMMPRDIENSNDSL